MKNYNENKTIDKMNDELLVLLNRRERMRLKTMSQLWNMH